MSNHNELLASHRVLSMLESACEYSEQVLDKVPSLFVVLSGDNRIIRANATFCQLAGVTMEEALHRDFGEFFSTEHRDHLLHQFAHVRGTASLSDAKASAQLDMVCPTGARPFFWRIFRSSHLSQAEGTVISVLGDDLSALYQSELKLMSIFSSIPLGLMVIDRNSHITEVLSEYCHVLLDRRKLLGESLASVLAQGNESMHDPLNEAFRALRECVDRPLLHFGSLELLLSRLERIRIANGAQERWVRPRFQPIARNGLVERFLVILEDMTANHLAQQQIEKADLLGKQAQALYDCAIRDPLSGLYTRLFMNDSINPLVASVRRGNVTEMALLMLDIDNFKHVNDTYGHDAGDRVIQAMGQVIKSCIRDTDIAVRYGGEEFLVALPCAVAPHHGGATVAERIRATLEATPIAIGGGRTIHVTTSCGVAYCHVHDSLPALIQRADQHLYAAKRGGKNRVSAESE